MKIKKTIATLTLGAVLSGGAITVVSVAGPALVGAETSAASGDAASGSGGFVEKALIPLVSDGTLTQSQADAVKGALKAQHDDRQAKRAERRTEMINAAAAFFGLSADEVTAKWQAGSSLADMAAETGHSREELVDAMVKAIDARADAAAAAGTITAEQAAKLKDKAPALADRMADAHGGHTGGHRGLLRGLLGR